jgi:hypothetical protein
MIRTSTDASHREGPRQEGRFTSGWPAVGQLRKEAYPFAYNGVIT